MTRCKPDRQVYLAGDHSICDRPYIGIIGVTVLAALSSGEASRRACSNACRGGRSLADWPEGHRKPVLLKTEATPPAVLVLNVLPQCHMSVNERPLVRRKGANGFIDRHCH